MTKLFSTVGLDNQQGIVPGIWLEGNRHASLSEVKFGRMRCPLLQQASC